MEENINQTLYEKDIQSRTTLHYYKGLAARWKQYFKLYIAHKEG